MGFSRNKVQVHKVVRLAKLFLACYNGDTGTQEVQERKRSKNRVMTSTTIYIRNYEDKASLVGLLWDNKTSLGPALLPVIVRMKKIPILRTCHQCIYHHILVGI